MFHVSDIAHSLERCGQTEGHGSNEEGSWEGGWGVAVEEEQVVVLEEAEDEK